MSNSDAMEIFVIAGASTVALQVTVSVGINPGNGNSKGKR